MPYPTGQPFNTLFNPRRFDLVYGRASARSKYLDRLPRNLKAGMREAFVMLDEYNNTLGLSGSYNFATPVRGQRYENIAEARVNYLYPSGGSTSDQAKGDELNAYTGALFGSRYSPTTLAQRSDQELQGEGFATREDNITWKIIRSSCKFGIDYVVNHGTRGQKLHFVLDTISDHDIIVKTVFPGYDGQLAAPITTSELRSVYRRWDEFKDHVIFYRNFICVRPPWDTNPAWDQYGTTRVNKYIGKLSDARGQYPAAYGTHQVQIQGDIFQAATLSGNGDFNGAVGVLKHALSLIVPALPPIGGIAPEIGAKNQPLSVHVKRVIDAYDGQKGLFRRKSQESQAASARMRQLLGDFPNLARAVRHYLGLDSTAAALVPNGLSAKLGKSSTMHDMLMKEYKDWLGIREEVDFGF